MKNSFVVVLFLVTGCAHSSVEPTRMQASVVQGHFVNCSIDPAKQVLRSAELQEIVKADQADRQLPGNKIDWDKVSPADEARAKRVAEIFAEGCFHTAADYSAAALVFQHGVVPDHYYQAYLWSKRAFDLGDKSQKFMIANAIDRYLLSLGYKQIFGAQTFRTGPNACHCLDPVDKRFSDKARLKICGISLGDRIASLHKNNEQNPECHEVVYCEKDLKPTPKGLFPGIW